jgi:hypothetical protein
MFVVRRRPHDDIFGSAPERSRHRRQQRPGRGRWAHLHFQTIGDLGEKATPAPADLKKTYRAMVLQHHPDKNTGSTTTLSKSTFESECLFSVGSPAKIAFKFDEDQGTRNASKYHA